MEDKFKELNELTLKHLRPIMVDQILHPWLYDIRPLILLKLHKIKLPHSPQDCDKCKIAFNLYPKDCINENL